MQVKARVKQLFGDIRGATAVEYGVILMLITLVLIAGVNTLGGSVVATWTDVADKTAG
jgi:pilus assembly protein Flp/PilA